MRILITGGTGSLGHKLTAHLLANGAERIVIYSRDEYKQSQMQKEYPDKRMRFFLGDVRDEERLIKALKGVDTVIHAAALKRVNQLEYNPGECLKTNVLGTTVVINACIKTQVEKAVFLSTDKSVAAINIYGLSKAMAERLWLDACFYKPIFRVTRYGNVMGSRGSVLELYRDLCAKGKKELPLTNPGMSRFWTSFDQAIGIIELALAGLPHMIYVPKARAFSMTNLIAAFGKRARFIGIRPGEKYAETLIHEYEMPRTRDMGDHYQIRPEIPYDDEIEWPIGEVVSEPLSSEAPDMTIGEIRRLLDADTVCQAVNK